MNLEEESKSQIVWADIGYVSSKGIWFRTWSLKVASLAGLLYSFSAMGGMIFLFLISHVYLNMRLPFLFYFIVGFVLTLTFTSYPWVLTGRWIYLRGDRRTFVFTNKIVLWDQSTGDGLFILEKGKVKAEYIVFFNKAGMIIVFDKPFRGCKFKVHYYNYFIEDYVEDVIADVLQASEVFHIKNEYLYEDVAIIAAAILSIGTPEAKVLAGLILENDIHNVLHELLDMEKCDDKRMCKRLENAVNFVRAVAEYLFIFGKYEELMELGKLFTLDKDTILGFLKEKVPDVYPIDNEFMMWRADRMHFGGSIVYPMWVGIISVGVYLVINILFYTILHLIPRSIAIISMHSLLLCTLISVMYIGPYVGLTYRIYWYFHEYERFKRYSLIGVAVDLVVLSVIYALERVMIITYGLDMNVAVHAPDWCFLHIAACIFTDIPSTIAFATIVALSAYLFIFRFGYSGFFQMRTASKVYQKLIDATKQFVSQ